MSHPINRRERTLLGGQKGKKRASNLFSGTTPVSGTKKELIEHWAHRLKDTTKTCSCVLCGNPRKFFKDETMQEKKRKDWKEEI